MLDSQPRLNFVPDYADHHLWTGSFLAFPFDCKTLGMGGAVAAFALVAGKLFANGALAATNGLSDLVLGLSSLLHVGDYFTVFRTEAVVFVVHS